MSNKAKPKTGADKSPYVAQNTKLDKPLAIGELPWTARQQKFIELAMDKKVKVIFVEGPAGSSKTMLAIYCALQLLNLKRVSDLVLVRTAVESADASLGFLPGSLDDKFGVYTTPFYDKLNELLPTSQIAMLEKENRLIEMPINFARGLHWAAKCVIFDETQNASQKEIKTFLTRIGEFSKVFVLGDSLQSDLPKNKSGSFDKMFKWFEAPENKEFFESEGVYTFRLTEEDIVRSQLVKFFIKEFQKMDAVQS
jgi:phosphate starvation-inducible PhoH-like protein